MTLRPLQTWFEKMSPRERVMLLGFAWAVVVLWGSLLMRQVKSMRAEIATKQAVLKSQQDSLNQKPKVMTQIAYYQEKFKTSVSAGELMSRATTYYKGAGMPAPTINAIRNDSKKESIFNVNSISVHFTKTPYRSLVDFTSRVLADKPYLIINDLTVSPERTDPRLMTDDMRIFSLELKPGALDVSAPASAIK
jgi:hypothetical protein